MEKVGEKTSPCYALRCVGCGQEIHRQKQSKVINHYKNYRCAKCGGKFERIF